MGSHYAKFLDNTMNLKRDFDMRIFLLSAAMVLVSAPVMAKEVKDTALNCAQLQEAIAEVDATIASAKTAKTVKETTSTAGSVASQGASAFGLGNAGMISGLSGIAGTLSDHHERSTAEAAQGAEARKIKLETIAEMKECKF